MKKITVKTNLANFYGRLATNMILLILYLPLFFASTAVFFPDSFTLLSKDPFRLFLVLALSILILYTFVETLGLLIMYLNLRARKFIIAEFDETGYSYVTNFGLHEGLWSKVDYSEVRIRHSRFGREFLRFRIFKNSMRQNWFEDLTLIRHARTEEWDTKFDNIIDIVEQKTGKKVII